MDNKNQSQPNPPLSPPQQNQPQQTPPPPQIQPSPQIQPQQNQPVTPSQMGVPTPGNLAGQKSKKMPIIFGAIGLVLLLTVATSYYLFAYLPNTPENVWRRGLASIGVGLEELSARSEESAQSSTSTEISGTLNVEEPLKLTSKMTGEFSITGNAQLNMDLEYNGAKSSLDLIAKAGETLSTPEAIFLKFSGIDDLISAAIGEDINVKDIFGQEVQDIWWEADSEQFGLDDNTENNDLTQFSADDSIAIQKAVLEATNEYFFTADTEKMTLEMIEDLGVEDFDGVESRKYLVTINQQRLKDYLATTRDKLAATGVLERLAPDYDIQESLSNANIHDIVEDLDLSDTRIEAWVGLNNKVLRNVRFTPLEDTTNENYVEFSILLDDTNIDKIPIRARIKSDGTTTAEPSVGEFESTLTLDTVNNSFSLDISMSLNDDGLPGTDKMVFDANLTMKSSSTEPAIEVPQDAKSLRNLFPGAPNIVEVLGINTER